jgi:hypothetical protein
MEQASPYFGAILNLIYEDAQRTNFIKSDTTTPPGTNMFVSTLSLDKIRHAYPALVTWATLLVANKVNEEANNMIARETGLHLRAQAKEGGRGKSEESKVSWDKVNSFSLSSVRGIANEHAPMMSFLLNSYTTKERGRVNTNVGEVTAVRIYRPEPVVS